MKTIEEVKAHCDVFPYDHPQSKKEHWIWNGGMSIRRGRSTPSIFAPNFTKDPSGSTSTAQGGRRAVIHIMTGKPIPKKLKAAGVCNVDGCISPDCTKLLKSKELGKIIAKSGVQKGDVNKSLGAMKRWAKSRKVTPEKLDVILNDPRPASHLEPVLGVHKSTITMYRRGELRGPVANPFAGLVD